MDLRAAQNINRLCDRLADLEGDVGRLKRHPGGGGWRAVGSGWRVGDLKDSAVPLASGAPGVNDHTEDGHEWLWCDGRAVSRTDYADLFAAVGTAWGPGDGSTTFDLPDLRRRVSVGANPAAAPLVGENEGNEVAARKFFIQQLQPTSLQNPVHLHDVPVGPPPAYAETGTAVQAVAYPPTGIFTSGEPRVGTQPWEPVVLAPKDYGDEPIENFPAYAAVGQFILAKKP